MLAKKPKYFSMYNSGLPKTRKERDKFYRILERTGIMKQIFDDNEILIRKKG